MATTHPGWGDLINTEVWLPLQGWNERIQMTGGGGLSTGLLAPNFAMIGAVNDGYAAVGTDGGHGGDDPSTWGLTSAGNVNLYKLLDYSTSSLHEAIAIGKAITNDFYGRKPSFSYFVGCSTGGRQGLMYAQNFPQDFDGIIAAAPGINYNSAILQLFYPLLRLKEYGTFPAPCELAALTAAAVQECDSKDNVTDGIISAPELCAFDPFTLVGHPINCSGLESKISRAAAFAANETWSLTVERSTTLWLGLGHQADLSGLVNTTCDQKGHCAGVPFSPVAQWLTYFVAKNPTYDWNQFTVQDMYAFLKSPDNRLYDGFLATNSLNLAPFAQAGGKMITYHGLADQYIPTNVSRIYYDNLLELDPDAARYYRYYQAPGVGHCSGGAGPVPVDTLDKLVNWVEQGVAPDFLEGQSSPNAQGVVYKRPICVYPGRAVYKGQGDITQADSWECK
jgi:pimeloyl-ACP methyl ester carboxylesterase